MAKGDTHFGGLVYSMGVPTVGGGGIPLTFGTYYFVDSDVGSDGNKGTSMDRAVKTVLVGYNKMTTQKNDVLVLSAVGAHTLTAELAVAKNNVHFVGLGLTARYFGQGTRFEMASGGSANSGIILNTGKRNSFSNIKFFNTDTSTSFAVRDGGEFSQWNYCEFVNTVNLGTTTDAHLLCNADSGHYYKCSFGSSQTGHAISGARAVVLFTRGVAATGKVCRDSVFEECIFIVTPDSTAALHFYAVGATAIERILWVKRCTFWASPQGSQTQAVAISFDLAQTDGNILLEDCVHHGVTDLTVDGGVAVGVFHSRPTTGGDDAGGSVQTGAT